MPIILIITSILSAVATGISATAKVATSAATVAVDLLKVIVPPVIEFIKFLFRFSFWIFVAFIAGVPLTFALYHINMLFVFGLSWFLCWTTIVMLKGMFVAVLALWIRSFFRS